MYLHEQILAAALNIRADFNAANPIAPISRIELAGLMGEAIGALSILNDKALENLLET